LAAPQVGISKRFVVIDLDEFHEVLINPKWSPWGRRKKKTLKAAYPCQEFTAPWKGLRK